MSEVEIHALGFIRLEPGMTAKRLGQLTYRSEYFEKVIEKEKTKYSESQKTQKSKKSDTP